MLCVWPVALLSLSLLLLLLLLHSKGAKSEHRNHLQQQFGLEIGQVYHHHNELEHQRRQLWLKPAHPKGELETKFDSQPQQQERHDANEQALDRPQHLAPHSSTRLRLTRREAVDEAIRQLRILESQDEQLRAFAEVGSSRRPANGNGQRAPLARDFHCHLRLMTNERANSADSEFGERDDERDHHHDDDDEQIERRPRAPNSEEDNFCLRHGKLAAQIPPFMLNLYRQLAYEQHERTPHLNFSETVQMMPYKAEIMRSFRQPKLATASGDYDDELLPSGRPLDRAAIWLGNNDDVGGGGGESWPVEHNLTQRRRRQRRRRRRRHQADGTWKLQRTRHRSTLAPTRTTLNEQRQDKRRRSVWAEEPDEQHKLQQADRILIGGGGGQSGRIGNVVVELSVLNGSDDKRWQWAASERRPKAAAGAVASELPQASAACDLRRRLLPADEREEICFWFKLDDELTNVIATSSASELAEGSGGGGDGNRARERLVEAELHVFKLFPQSQSARSSELAAGQQQQQQPAEAAASVQQQQQTTATEQQFALANRTRATAGNLYHLKTNLLEVSLYQILPRKLIGSSAGGEAQQLSEFPLRLLDIRRIDLNSNGWETFYVKRAVEDWLRDERSNLGFVIKAKSMFDEPIRVGLIRFADAYDQVERAPASNGPDSVRRARKRRSPRRPSGKLELSPLEARSNFSLSHQPLLVLYTTRNR